MRNVHDLFGRAVRPATRQIIPQSTEPYIPIIAGSCRWYYPSTMRRCWVASEPVDSFRHCHSNIVEAPSFLCLHRAVEMDAAIVTSVPSDSHSPPGRQTGVSWRAPRWRPPPPPPSGPEAASPPAKKGRGAKKQYICLHLTNSLNCLLRLNFC